MRIRSLLLAGLVSGASFAQDTFDFSVVDKLREREKEALNQVLKTKEKKFNRVQREALKVQLADVLSSPTFLGHILKDSLLIKLASDEQVLLTKDINVRVHTLADKAGYVYLLNKEGVATHKTLGKNVSNIEEVTTLHEPPPYWQPVEKKEFVKTTDDGFRFFTELNLHLGLTSPKFTRDLVNDETENPGRAIRYELQAYSPFTLPFFVGANLMLESITGDLGGGDSYSASSISAGPLLKSPRFFIGEQSLYATLGARASISSKLQEARAIQAADYRIKQTSLFLGVQRDINLALGDFVLGANFQRQWSKASSDGYSSDLNSDAVYDDSFAISFGHKMGWPL